MPVQDATVRAFAAAFVLMTAAPLQSAGFGVFQQGAKGVGMAGAFTAQADDPSALFHNVGGIAHQRERAFQLGVSFISIDATEFVGVAPGLAAGTIAESESQFETPAHFYWVEPIGDRWTFGLAVNSPFGLTSEWAASDFAGRFLSRTASLTTLDVSSNLAWKASPTLGVGFGVIARMSEIELVRNLPALDPATGAVVDVAESKLSSDVDTGIGYQVGISSHPNPSWSWGFSYRSKVEIDYGGQGRLRQIPTTNPQLDALIGQSLPFGADLPLETAIEFPDMASLGVAVRPNREWLVEVDLNWTGWSTLTEYAIRFPQHSAFDLNLLQDWRDVYNYRLGIKKATPGAGSKGNEWRFGVSFDETPQPLSTLDPILPDGDQSAVTLGYGIRSAAAIVDLAVMVLDVEKRTTRTNISGYNGSYSSSALVFVSTVTW